MPTCYQRGFYKKLEGYDNTTLVADWHSPAGADIFPYPRPSGYIDGSPDALCGTAGYPLCGPWPMADRPTSATPPEVYHGWNTYDDSGDKVCLTACVDGHKVVQAKKFWHGQYGFTFCLDGSCQVQPVRYLTRRVRILGRFETTAGDGGYDLELKTTVDRNSGLITVDTQTYSATDPGMLLPDDGADIILPALNDTNCGFTLQLLGSYWSSLLAANLFYPITGTDISSLATSAASVMGGENLTLDGDAGGDFSDWLDATDSEITDTKFHFKITQHGTAYGITGWTAAEVLVELSNPYYPNHEAAVDAGDSNAPDLVTDTYTLLSEWSLINNNQLPWRTDGWRGLGVLCQRDETVSTSPDVDWGYTETNENTGAIIGSPFALGWPDKTFSWDHETKHCYDSGGVAWETSYYGATSGTAGLTPYTASVLDYTDAVIPTTSNNWTDNYLAGVYRPGSWMLYEAGTSLLTIQKQCEVKQRFPAYNLFRPCGSDRWMIDTAIASCVTSISGVDVVTDDALTGLTTDDLVVFVDGPNDGKVFEVAAISGTSLTLGTEIINPSGLADAFTDWQSLKDANRLEPFGVVGKVRFPDAWPICGKISCSSEQSGGDLLITLSEPANYLMAGDLIAFVDSDSADTILDDNGGAGYSVTVSDSTHITVTATLDETLHNRCVKALGAPLASWNTTDSRNDFVWQEWPADAATGTLDTTPTNEADTTATGRVLGSTPNSDTNGTWQTGSYSTGYPWASSLTLTSCGAEWLVIPIQFMVDPLWQTPFACDSDPVSICAPRVEAMLAVPDGAPALPGGVTFPIADTAPEGAGWRPCDTGAAEVLEFECPWIECT